MRERVIFAANVDIDDFFGLVLDPAVPVKSAFPNSARPEGECRQINASAFTMLHELISWGSVSLMGTALEAPRLGGSTTAAEPLKKKTNAGLNHTPIVRSRTDGAPRA